MIRFALAPQVIIPVLMNVFPGRVVIRDRSRTKGRTLFITGGNSDPALLIGRNLEIFNEELHTLKQHDRLLETLFMIIAAVGRDKALAVDGWTDLGP